MWREMTTLGTDPTESGGPSAQPANPLVRGGLARAGSFSSTTPIGSVGKIRVEVGWVFTDRIEAGQLLAERLEHLRDEDVVVLGLPRGGVPVALQVAEALEAPLDVIVVRKLGVPYQPELAMGAIGEKGVRIINDDVVSLTGVTSAQISEVEREERAELDRRAQLFRGGEEGVPLSGRTAVIVDDGIATGSTAMAAAQVARRLGAARVVVATPVAPVDVFDRLGAHADEVVVSVTPSPFFAIGEFYLDFRQTSDQEVIECLRRVPNHNVKEVRP